MIQQKTAEAKNRPEIDPWMKKVREYCGVETCKDAGHQACLLMRDDVSKELGPSSEVWSSDYSNVVTVYCRRDLAVLEVEFPKGYQRPKIRLYHLQGFGEWAKRNGYMRIDQTPLQGSKGLYAREITAALKELVKSYLACSRWINRHYRGGSFRA